MELIKAWGNFVDYFLGFGVTGLAIYHFTFEDIRSIILLVASLLFFCVKIYDAFLTAKIKKTKRESDALDVEIKRAKFKYDQLRKAENSKDDEAA